jgi:cytochrome c
LEGDNKTAAAPSLGGVIGRVAGSTTFKYSGSMKKAGFTWSDKHLFMFLKNPTKYVTGTKMAFAGLDSE